MSKQQVTVSWRQRIARWLAPAAPRRAVRSYGGARSTLTTGGFGASSTSADAELTTSLASLRSRSRQMVRDSAYAKRARDIVVNNVIGSGVGMQAQVMTTREALAARVNDSIEQAWERWCQADHCHTGGALHFSDLERAAMGEVFEAGEVLLRVHPRRFGRSGIPLALELVEAERVVTENAHSGVLAPGHELRMGVEVDAYQRPVAYWLRQRHSADIRLNVVGLADRIERVPAEQIFHLRVVTRWPQTRGEPWMHAVVRKLDDLNEYSQHEVTAARASAAYFATIETPEGDSPVADGEGDDGRQFMDVEPLTIQQLAPGEELKFHAPNRPNTALDGFLRAMLREVAAGTGTSYASLSCDYSQSNYSSSRLALMDDRDSYKALQQWWIRSFRLPLHRLWLQQAVLAGAVSGVPLEAYASDLQRYEAVRFKPRGWSWIDPTKEVDAARNAIRAGLTTLTDVIAQTADGRDIEDVIATRKRELQLLDEAGIEVDTLVVEPASPDQPTADVTAADNAPNDGADAARVFALRRGKP